MRKTIIKIISSFIFIVGLFILVSCGETENKTNDVINGELLDSVRSIKIVEMEGNATVTDETETTNCYKGMNLYDGDLLKVAESSVVVVRFDEDKYVYLGENTDVSIKSEGTDKYKTNVYVKKGIVLAEIQNKLGVDEEFFLSSNNSVMAVRGTIFGVKIEERDTEFVETYSVYRGVTELYVFDILNNQIIQGKLSDLSNTKLEIVVPKDHLLSDDDFNNLLDNWLVDVNNKFDDPTDANENLDEVNITVSKPTEEDYQMVIDALGNNDITYSDIEYVSTGFFGNYDGESHGINVSVKNPGATVYYKGEGETEYKTINDYSFVTPGSYRVYYKIECEGFDTKEDFEVVYITNPNVKITSDYIDYDSGSKSSILDISGISQDSFNIYNGIKADVILNNVKFYINDKEVNANDININYKHIIDNYIELVNGKNTLNVEFEFDNYTINADVDFYFIDTREDLGYLIGVSSTDLEKLSGNLYYLNKDVSSGAITISGNELLTSFGLDVENLTTMLINYSNDTYSNDLNLYDGTNDFTFYGNEFVKINFLVFPNSESKGFNETVYVYIDNNRPNNYPSFVVNDLEYAYNPNKNPNGVLMDFIESDNTITYSLDGIEYKDNLYIIDSGSHKVYYKIVDANDLTITGYEYVNVTVGEGKITFDNLKFITNPVYIISDDNNELTYTINNEKMTVTSNDGKTITSLEDTYLVYSNLIKNAKFYDSITKEEIDATVTILRIDENKANFNYTIAATGYDTLSGTVRFEYSKIGTITNGNDAGATILSVDLPSDYTISLNNVPTVIPTRISTTLEENYVNYKCYYSIDNGETWVSNSPKIINAGEYDIYTLYCCVDKGNGASSLVDSDLDGTKHTDLAINGNFIIAIQHISVIE